MESGFTAKLYEDLRNIKPKEITRLYSEVLLNARPYFKNPKAWWTKQFNIYLSPTDFRLKILFCHTYLDVEFNDHINVFSTYIKDIPKETLRNMNLVSKVKLLTIRGFLDIQDATDLVALNKVRNQIAHELVDDILKIDFSRFNQYAETSIESRLRQNVVRRQAKELFLAIKLLHLSGVSPEFGTKI